MQYLLQYHLQYLLQFHLQYLLQYHLLYLTMQYLLQYHLQYHCGPIMAHGKVVCMRSELLNLVAPIMMRVMRCATLLDSAGDSTIWATCSEIAEGGINDGRGGPMK